MASGDFEMVTALWADMDGVELAEGDDRESIEAYLRRNPRLSRVAEVAGKVVGAVLCGHDGRRGLIYHLAVAADHRTGGIGRRLVEECCGGLRACGIQRAIILVADDNKAGEAFWTRIGFEEITGAVPFGIDL